MRIGKPHPAGRTERKHEMLLATAALLLVVAFGLGTGGCESKPEAPVFDNAFDPAGPYEGDPLQIWCTFGDSTVIVHWRQPRGYGISFYSVSISDSPTTGFEFLGEVAADEDEENQYVFPDPTADGDYDYAEGTTDYYFRVIAFTEDGDYLLSSLQTPGLGSTGPIVAVAGGTTTPSRWLDLRIGVTRGASVRIDDNPAFDDALTFDFNESLDPIDVTWDLGPVEANGDTVRLYAQGIGDGFVSAIREKEIVVEFDPDLVPAGGSSTTATRRIELAASTGGVEQVRLATSAEDVEFAAWNGYLPENLVWELEDTLGEQSIYGQFRGDLGFDSEVDELTIAGDPLTDVAVDVDLDAATTAPFVDLLCDAVATQVRIGESGDFASASWQAYADTIRYPVETGPGHKILYVQYRNEFTDSGILTVEFDYLEQPLAIGFLSPEPSQQLIGGTQLQVSGWTAALPGETAIDSVKLDLADGAGWFEPDGLAEWSTAWTVPADTVSVDLALRARAWAGVDSVTARVDVTVVPAAAR